jgi:histidine triad (HIT) family protein
MSECIFCQIVAGTLVASIVHKDELCTAFMDIQPVNPGHMLVIPNLHAAYLADLNENTGAHIFQIAQRLSAALRNSGVKCEGVNFFLADGEAAMQEVFHFHLHVFPRFHGDGFGLQFAPSYFEKPERSKLETVAKQIRNAHH